MTIGRITDPMTHRTNAQRWKRMNPRRPRPNERTRADRTTRTAPVMITPPVLKKKSEMLRMLLLPV